MILQVIKNGEVKFWTDIESCVPREEQIKDLKKAGYKIKVIKDGNYGRKNKKSL